MAGAGRSNVGTPGASMDVLVPVACFEHEGDFVVAIYPNQLGG